MVEKSAIRSSRILIVDDNHANVQVLESLLRNDGYLRVDSTMDPTKVCPLHFENRYDLILLDLLMPDMDGFEVMSALKEMARGAPSILVVTAQPSHKLKAMQAGANDFISKPYDHLEMLTRIHYMLEVRILQRAAEDHSRLLEQTVSIRTAELRRRGEMFRQLAANIPEALWIRDIETQTIEYANPAWHELNGVRVSPGDPVESGLRAIHPNDLKWVGHNRRKVAEGAATNDYRLVRPDQSVRWVNARSFAIANPSGKMPWLAEIIEDVTQRREAQHHLLHLARHDALTGLPNRTLFYELLTEALARAERERLIVSVMLLDIDHFKTFNDTLGHPTGDAVLREFAARLVGCLRPEDAVGRLGGDEFAVIVTTPTDNFGARFVATRIQNALKAPLALEDRELVVTTSIGIASSPADAGDVEALIRCADNALYEAKAAGRNTFRSCTAEMNARAEKKSDVEAALRLAHERNEFVLHYQPKVQAEDGVSMSVEALIRWERPGHGLVLPNAFIPALEEMGLIAKVGAWVIDAACRQIRQWEAAGLGRIRVAVNVSSRQLREVQFVDQVADAMRTHHVDAALLEFEITESTFMVHGEPTDSALRGLKELGVSISIDDFGTGYSNLAYLQRFEVDALKIDIALIRDVTNNPDAATIAVAIINLAHSLRLKVIAEGVETAEQLEFLRLHGCDEVQGYFLSMPMAADELSARLRTAITVNARLDLKDLHRGQAHA